METVAYGGWNRCARIKSGTVEAIVTLEVGPRVIRLGFEDGPNEFHEDPDEMGKTGGSEYRSYGGHRLWIAPEDKVRTYQPENEPVDYAEEGGWHRFSPKTDRFGMHKELAIKPLGDGGFVLQHRITNQGEVGVQLAPWAITVMAAGGTCLIPQAPFKPFPEILTAVRPVALWSYMNMSDPRVKWGSRLIHLRQDANLGPTKLGTAVSQGYAGYIHDDRLFLKQFDLIEGQHYPDFGCNFETFTRQDMLEFETLGPLHMLGPGESVLHTEQWHLFGNVHLPSDEDGMADALESYSHSKVAVASAV